MKNTKRNTWNINFLDNKQVNLSCSIIKFMKDMTALDLLTPQDEKDFLNFLISFLRLKNIIYITSKVSNIIQGDMIIKEKSILKCVCLVVVDYSRPWSIINSLHKWCDFIYDNFGKLIMKFPFNIQTEIRKKSKKINI